MGEHLIDGEFQSDKYPTTPRGKVPLSCKDPTAQDLLWEYAQRRRSVDAEFADDLEEALRIAGYIPKASSAGTAPAATDTSSTPAGTVAGVVGVGPAEVQLCEACGVRQSDRNLITVDGAYANLCNSCYVTNGSARNAVRERIRARRAARGGEGKQHGETTPATTDETSDTQAAQGGSTRRRGGTPTDEPLATAVAASGEPATSVAYERASDENARLRVALRRMLWAFEGAIDYSEERAKAYDAAERALGTHAELYRAAAALPPEHRPGGEGEKSDG